MLERYISKRLVDVQLPTHILLVHKRNTVDGNDHFIVWNWRKGKAEMVSNSFFLCIVLIRVLLLTWIAPAKFGERLLGLCIRRHSLSDTGVRAPQFHHPAQHSDTVRC
jgi:hypothetical protein